jgi:GWxTD domain-containing protein
MKASSRERGSNRFGRVIVTLVWCAFWTPKFAEESPVEEPNQSWRTGPVRWILTPNEDRTYKHLTSDEKKAEFIRMFWAKRDPVPETPENEFRDSFWKRVQEANAWFREGNREGWETDRGRILLTAGYPDDRCGEGGPVEGWLYSRSFPSRMGLENPAIKMRVNFSVAFARTGSAGYKAKAFRDLSDGESLLANLLALEPRETARYAVGRDAMPPSHPGHEDPNHLLIDSMERNLLSPK